MMGTDKLQAPPTKRYILITKKKQEKKQYLPESLVNWSVPTEKGTRGE